jgi:Na+/H+-dicarboxylate symporter
MDAIAHVLLKVTGYIMTCAPLAVFGAMTAIIATQGIGILKTYSIFVADFTSDLSSFGYTDSCRRIVYR